MHLIHIDKILHKTPAAGEIPDERELLQNTMQVAWPSIVESFLVSLVGMIDMIMVGSLGSYAIAAVGLTTQPKFIGLAIFVSLNVAVSALVARRRGEQDQESANKVLVQALLITLGLTVVVTALCVGFADQIIRFAGSAPDTHADAVAYFRIIMGGLIFNSVTLVINAAQRGAGNTRIAMRTNMVSNGVNLLFNYLLIGGNFGFPKLGVKGAAIATVIGTVFGLVLSVRSVSHPDQFLYFHGLRHVRFDRRTIRTITSISSSTLAEQVFLRIGFFTYAIIVAHLGTVAFAAHQIGMNLLTINFSLGDGLSAASIALVGRSLGENRADLARIYGSVCQRIGLFFSCVLAVIYLSVGKYIFMLFSQEAQILAFAPVIITPMILIVFMQIANVTFSGCLRAAGDTVFVAVVSLISVTFIRPFSGWLFCYPLQMGLMGAWLGLTVDQALRSLLNGLRFAGGRWTKIKI
ncbi:MATE family efflux transporter [Anaerotruncus rubiinfantis]|uniref:MATE family efflux transporter n=1 Tax=Anaerotruncus rubiinfantis TaxID=1720200 RepID=UPI001FAAB4EB|nr:MATE family efflux transporter [Anaerotruncus rubiinfantis]